MTDINFQPMFDYLDGPFKESLMTEIREEFNGKFDALLTIMDKILVEVKATREEMPIMNYRTKQLEDWAKPAGTKIGLPFNT